MSLSELKTLEEFENFIKSDKLTIVDFWATWCGPCIKIAPWLKEQAEKDEHKDIQFGKVDVDDNAQASEKAEISCMPTFKIYKAGKLINTIEGADKEELEKMFKLDDSKIDELKKKQEEEELKKAQAEKVMPMLKAEDEYNNFIKAKNITFSNFYVDGYKESCTNLQEFLLDLCQDESNKNFNSEDNINVMRCDLNEHGVLGNVLKIRSLPHLRVNYNGQFIKVIDDFDKSKSQDLLDEMIKLSNMTEDEINLLITERKAEEERLSKLVKQLDEEKEYMDAINDSTADLVVVDYYATWCGPCIRFAPTFIKMADEYSKKEGKTVKFFKIDCDKNSAAKKHAVVKCYPTFKLWKNGVKKDEMEGAGEAPLRELIEKHL
jgi:thioredoxin 1